MGKKRREPLFAGLAAKPTTVSQFNEPKRRRFNVYQTSDVMKFFYMAFSVSVFLMAAHVHAESQCIKSVVAQLGLSSSVIPSMFRCTQTSRARRLSLKHILMLGRMERISEVYNCAHTENSEIAVIIVSQSLLIDGILLMIIMPQSIAAAIHLVQITRKIHPVLYETTRALKAISIFTIFGVATFCADVFFSFFTWFKRDF